MRIGLISDTHIPSRCRELPGSIVSIFENVDLILHAGDIGELDVLSGLEHVAPVVAVFGNDEPERTAASLPFQRELAVEGQKLLLMHGHDVDSTVERKQRLEDRWPEKLTYWAGRGHEAGASIVIYGHTHVPTAYEQEGILLVNSGALSSGSFFCREILRTVAILSVGSEGKRIEHFDVDNPGEPVDVSHEWSGGFAASMFRFHRPMYDQVVLYNSQWIRDNLYPLDPRQVLDTVESLARECWFDGREWVTAEAFVERLLSKPESRGAFEDALAVNADLATYVGSG